MKIHPLAIFFVCALVSIANTAESAKGKLTFVRPGDNGFLNIWPATIVIEGEGRHELIGENSITIELPFGRYRFHVESPDPYDHSSAGVLWYTSVFEITIGPEEVEFTIEGGGSKDGYDHWEVRKKTALNQALQLHTDIYAHPFGVAYF